MNPSVHFIRSQEGTAISLLLETDAFVQRAWSGPESRDGLQPGVWRAFQVCAG